MMSPCKYHGKEWEGMASHQYKEILKGHFCDIGCQEGKSQRSEGSVSNYNYANQPPTLIGIVKSIIPRKRAKPSHKDNSDVRRKQVRHGLTRKECCDLNRSLG